VPLPAESALPDPAQALDPPNAAVGLLLVHWLKTQQACLLTTAVTQLEKKKISWWPAWEKKGCVVVVRKKKAQRLIQRQGWGWLQVVDP